MIPKFYINKFKKATNIIKTEHKNFVDDEVSFIIRNGMRETGARYDSAVGGGYRAFRDGEYVYIAIAPNNYYIVKIIEGIR